MSSAPSSSTLKSKVEFIAKLALRMREEDLKRKKSVKDAKSARKRTRTETKLKDTEMEITLSKETEQVNPSSEPKQDQLISTPEYPPTVEIHNTSPRAPAQPALPFVLLNNIGPVVEFCNTSSVWLGSEIAKSLQVPEDVRKVYDMDANERVGHIAAHLMQGQAWLGTIVQEHINTQAMLATAKDDLKAARADMNSVRAENEQLKGKVQGLEGKLEEAQSLYVGAQRTGLENMDKLEKHITELKKQVEEEGNRADLAEIDWFSKGQDDRIRVAKEVGLDYKKILVDPRFNPCETESSAEESEKQLGRESGDEN